MSVRKATIPSTDRSENSTTKMLDLDGYVIDRKSKVKP